jgi:hypothetical protein
MSACAALHSEPLRAVAKPAGGFRPIGVQELFEAWWSYRNGILSRYLDLRVYLALHECDERRLAARRTRASRGKAGYQATLRRESLIRELKLLLRSTSERLARAALRRLESAGFVSMAETGITFGKRISHPSEHGAKERSAGVSRLRDFGARRLPVPRPMLRYLARTASPSIAATALGHVIRTSWWEGVTCRIQGQCKAREIFDLFGADVRSVKRARAELRRIGWLLCVDGETDGVADSNCINLFWQGETVSERRPTPTGGRTDLSPPPGIAGTKMSRLTTMIQLRTGSTQQPGSPNESGVRGEGKAGPKPQMSHVVPGDLDDSRRLDALFDQAASLGLVRRSACDHLRFFAAAERAKAVSTRNPCGFFAAVVRRGLCT